MYIIINYVGNLLYNLFYIFVLRYNVKQKKVLKNRLIMQEENKTDCNIFSQILYVYNICEKIDILRVK